MLPKNHKITEIVKAMNESSQPSNVLSSNYISGLNADQQLEFQRIMDTHQRAKSLYSNLHPENIQAPQTTIPEPIHHQPQPQYRARPQEIKVFIYDNRRDSYW